ncbi:MAG: ribonuclease J [Dehalococcoidales bacterium]|nr:ribonuclease J [Dehalococcoidales bacterium]
MRKNNKKTGKLRIIPLGGLGEIGKNMTVLEYGGEIIIIDAGLMFPEQDMLGIDMVIPDISYLLENKEKIKAIFITHAHEDHVGALPYILPQLNVPLYCTKLAKGLISGKLKERKALAGAELNVITFGEQINLGKFRVEFFPVCHSIPDAAGLIIQTPIGTVVHTGDFKLDHTPITGPKTDLSRLAQAGSQGVLLLFSDSTYAEIPGYTLSEQVVGEALENIIAHAEGRVIVTTFASLVTRVQQVIDAAAKHNRKVFIIGRSMTDTVKISLELGYLKAPNGVLAKIEELHKLPNEKVVIITTGSQGEPTSGLVRISNHDHRQVSIIKGDTVIYSASPIPGNESLVNKTVDNLFKQGAKVYYGRMAQTHVHGHASQEELKLMLNLVKPRFFIPVHGEFRHLASHAKLAESVGIPQDRIFTLEDGDILELTTLGGKKAGKVESGNVYVDGLSVGDVGGIVLRNRRMLSRDGIVVIVIAVTKKDDKLVGRPDIVTRGFIDINEYKDMLETSKDIVTKIMKHEGEFSSEIGFPDSRIRAELNKFYFDQTKRRPMILPVMVKV